MTQAAMYSEGHPGRQMGAQTSAQLEEWKTARWADRQHAAAASYDSRAAADCL